MNRNEVGTSKRRNASSVKEFISISAELFAAACFAKYIILGSEHLMPPVYAVFELKCT
jgi:hypothetical protein